ncbi:uncharacterized protein I303_107731 [Kwoniella dejecticola CBS 10117]|uniref:Uncharacterized protein n=1 Tax=Kwoniella dejecticola CBS 10117 TaxID=1296121 RepID=A0A1A5ZVI9_9TREE|nr:uncharacterized protein I303_07736 [Kwoniella dejecticola CBS 10117]OBR81826.1 hypothetical protein I303_07736 [Kwoniella dejecticola CBS 10117]
MSSPSWETVDYPSSASDVPSQAQTQTQAQAQTQNQNQTTTQGIPQDPATPTPDSSSSKTTTPKNDPSSTTKQTSTTASIPVVVPAFPVPAFPVPSPTSSTATGANSATPATAPLFLTIEIKDTTSKAPKARPLPPSTSTATATSTSNRYTRYLPPKIEDAFIGPILPTFKETIALLKRHCPSLSTIDPSEVSLNLRFDGVATLKDKEIKFQVLPDCWPDALTSILSLVVITVKDEVPVLGKEPKTGQVCDPKATGKALSVPTDRQIQTDEEGEHVEVTWDDLKNNQQVLGIGGYRGIPANNVDDATQGAEVAAGGGGNDGGQKKIDPKVEFDFNRYSFDGFM